MKLFKKTAALLFCLALIVSVMAISASADDEAELLTGIAEPVPNAAFTVTLEKVNHDATTVSGDYDTTNGSFASIDATTTNNILDRDYNNVADRQGFEIKKTEDVTFAIKLAYTGDTFEAAGSTTDSINGFQFTYDPGTATTAGNKGVTISGLNIWGQDVYTLRKNTDFTANNSPYAQYANVYAFGALGLGENDIPMPTSAGIIIGAITFSFDEAAKAEKLTPTIKTMLVQVRDNQHPQWIVKAGDGASLATSGGTSEYPYGPTNYVTQGNPSTSFTAPAADGLRGYEDGTASTYPIVVNPYYNITVNHFKANDTTGVMAVVTDTSDAKRPSTVKYYFDKGDIPSEEATTANTLTEEDAIPGYTFQGWMVTANSTSSATWDAYVNSGASKDGDWTGETSYKQRVTASTLTDAMVSAKSWKAWNDDNESDTAFINFVSRGLALSSHLDGQGVSGVKFIPQGTTTIPTGYVGPITLTPVYTRDAYTVTFKADDFTTNTNSKATFSKTATTKERTDYYTIEDLASDSNAAVDYLHIAYTEGTAPFIAQTGANKELNKPGYKFVGWVPSGDGYTSSNTGYQWLTDSTTRVNSTSVIRNNTETNAAPNQMKRYGNLTLTAEWELDIYFAKATYWFGGANNALILVAVPSATSNNYVSYYTYKCTSKDASNNDTPNAMFKIPDGAQKSAYMQAAMTAQSEQASSTDADSKYTITSELFNSSNGTYKDNYVLYAYIADSETKELAITLDETTTTETCGNTSIAYDGDVDGSGFVSVADFGNVDTLLNNTNSAIFAITSRDGVEARLEADKTTDTDGKDTAGRAFASIADVKAIYNVMGYNAQPAQA